MGTLPFSIHTGALALVSSLLLAACASTPLEGAPVADGGASATAPAAGTAARSAVAPVTALRAPQGGQGPANAADERDGREYNLALGQQRAEAARRALQLLGAQAAQIETASLGEEKPAVAAHEEAAWSGNRRAETAYR